MLWHIILLALGNLMIDDILQAAHNHVRNHYQSDYDWWNIVSLNPKFYSAEKVPETAHHAIHEYMKLMSCKIV